MQDLCRGDPRALAPADPDDRAPGVDEAQRDAVRRAVHAPRGSNVPSLAGIGDLSRRQRDGRDGLEARVRREEELADPVRALRRRGGMRCEPLTDGVLRVGPVVLELFAQCAASSQLRP